MKKTTLVCTTLLLMGMVSSKETFAQNTTFEEGATTHSSNIDKKEESTVVNTFDELKKVLSENNGISQIELGSDINLNNGIKINPQKKTVTIDGKGHVLNEQAKGSHGTIYVSETNGTNNIMLKNVAIKGINYYGPINIDDAVKGVTLDYENVTYKGPQLVHNVHGYAKFWGNNTIDITNENKEADVAQELFEGEGIDISGNFKLTHEGKTDSAFWFGLGNDSRPYFNIKDNANVSMDILYNTLFYVDNSATKPLDITVGKHVSFDVNTQRELFRLGYAGNVNFLDDSKTNILRSCGNSNVATVNLNKSTFDVKPTASLNILHQKNTKADIFKSKNESLIRFENAKNVELKTSPGYKVFDSKKTKLNVTTKSIQAWHDSDKSVPDYQNNVPLEATFNIDNSVDLISSNQEDILSKWNILKTNHLLLNNSQEKLEDPIVNAITDADIQLTGTGIPGNRIILSLNGNKLGEAIADSAGKWVFPLTNKLKAGETVMAVQTDGNLFSNSVEEKVEHLSSETKNNFALGYWQDYGMILEGQIDNKDWDLTNPNAINKFINLVAEDGNVKLKVGAANTSWFGDPNKFDGYQAILTNNDLATLPKGKYKLQIGIKGPNIDVVQDLESKNSSEELLKTTPYRDEFEKIDKQVISDKQVSTMVQGNVCFILIE
ncbi:TPA: pectate lyase-like adhesive domain-containing protein [Enterococcus faecalis]